MATSRKPRKTQWIIGIDEVGRGALAGPLTVGAVLLDAREAQDVLQDIAVRDSKGLSAKQRETVVRVMRQAPALYSVVASVSAARIDRIGIAPAGQRGVRHVLRKITRRQDVVPGAALVVLDGGLYAPADFSRQMTVVKGDVCCGVVAAASVQAKVHRDRLMMRYHLQYPHYGFDVHKGYATRLHYKRLRRKGPSPIHRRSFRLQ